MSASTQVDANGDSSSDLRERKRVNGANEDAQEIDPISPSGKSSNSERVTWGKTPDGTGKPLQFGHLFNLKFSECLTHMMF